MIRVYGIKNCDTCRKAIKWLEAHNADYEFRDVRDKPMTRSLIDNWTGQLGWELLVNRRSTTWRGLVAPRVRRSTAAPWPQRCWHIRR